MSNQVIIQHHEVKNLDTGEKWREANIFDSYGNLASVPVGVMPVDNLALFSKIVEEQLECDYAGVDDILQYLYETKSGITIAGKYYFYEDIKAALEYYRES
jgi:hypothetical protein